MRQQMLCLALCLLAMMIASTAYSQDYVGKYMKDMKGKDIPELVSKDGDWINSESKLTFAGLSDKLVYIEFSFLG